MDRLYQIFAVSWMLMGGFIIWNPRYLARRLARKGSRQLRYSLMLVVFYLCGTLMAIAGDFSSPWSHVLRVIAVIGVVKGLSLLRASIATALARTAARLPSLLMRIGGVCYVVFGVWLFLRAGAPPPEGGVQPDSTALEELIDR